MWYALVAHAAAQAPPPLSPDARFALALFCNPTCPEEVVDALDDGLAPIAAKSGFPDSAERPIRVMGIAGADFGIPDAAFVELYGTGVDRPEELAKSEEVLLAWIAGPREEAVQTLAVAHAAFAAAAKKSGGWVEDLDTQRLYGADAWAALDPKGPVTDWFVVDAEPQDAEDPEGPLRLVTRGLRRYGDHELVVETVPADAAGDVSFVINAIAEDRRKNGHRPGLTLDTPTVRGKASFRAAARRETDPEEPLLRAIFDGEIVVPPDPDAPAPLAEDPPPPIAVAAAAPAPTAPATNGAGAPGALPATATDSAAPAATLEDAQKQARERFARVVRPAFAAGLPVGEAVAVKAPFRTQAGGTEYMWVELRSVNGDDLVGVLMNEPYAVPGLRKGDAITLRQADIFDYVWKKADGTREGNTTAAFLD